VKENERLVIIGGGPGACRPLALTVRLEAGPV
jgi:hypothetical protein